MKSLWIVNKCCGALHRKRFGKESTGGQWLDAMLEQAAMFQEDRIVVVNIEKKPVIDFFQEGNVSFYTLKGEPNEKYDYKSPRVLAEWKRILEDEKPDIIEVWGAEFPYSLAAMAAAPKIPTVVFAQGVLDSIAKYYLSGLTKAELRQAKSLRDVLAGQTIEQTRKSYEKRAAYEAEIIRRSGHVIIENQWAYAYYKKICPTVTAHFCTISISDSFAKQTWREETMESHSILCSAANYPIKGLHMLLKALKIVKQMYPDVKLYIPGTKLRRAEGLINSLKQNGYEKLIQNMQESCGLGENVFYTGRLTANEMAQKMASVNCFVMCSAIENHSSTLKEAMTVGTPCIASYVGGVSEYAEHGGNCLLYRYEDYEVLAQNICRVFENVALRKKLSVNAATQMKKERCSSDYIAMRNILEKVLLGGVE